MCPLRALIDHPCNAANSSTLQHGFLTLVRCFEVTPLGAPPGLLRAAQVAAQHTLRDIASAVFSACFVFLEYLAAVLRQDSGAEKGKSNPGTCMIHTCMYTSGDVQEMHCCVPALWVDKRVRSAYPQQKAGRISRTLSFSLSRTANALVPRAVVQRDELRR